MDDPAWVHYWLLLLLLLLKNKNSVVHVPDQWERDTAWILSGKHPMSKNRSSFYKVDTTPCLPKDGCVFFPMEAHETHGAFIVEHYIVNWCIPCGDNEVQKMICLRRAFSLRSRLYIYLFYIYIFHEFILFFHPKLS